jgi:hypothetical protein
MMIHELLTLGADVFESELSKEKAPPLPPLSPEEQQIFDAADKDTRARLSENRAETARRRTLLDRNRYVVTRLHHRYDDKGLPTDIKLRSAGHVQGGLGTPSGPRGELPTAVVESQESRLQVRYNFFHENKKVLHCDAPVRYRWGQAPRSYRGLRKTWTARDLAYKKPNRFDLKEVIKSAVPALGIAGVAPAPTEQVAAAASDDESACALALPGAGSSSGKLPAALLLLGLASLTVRGRQRSRR